jgi:hypothetical protein
MMTREKKISTESCVLRTVEKNKGEQTLLRAFVVNASLLLEIEKRGQKKIADS